MNKPTLQMFVCAALLGVLGLWVIFSSASARVQSGFEPSLAAQRSSGPQWKGQQPTTASTGIPLNAPLRFEHLNLEDGLSQNSIFFVFQDSQGFLWVGTQDGLNRYDGYEFRVFKHDPDDTGSISINSVLCAAEDKDGAIWFGTWDGGLNRYNPVNQSFTRYRHDTNNPNSLTHDLVTDLLVDSSGQLWVATSGGGLDRYDPQRDGFVHHRHNPQDSTSLSGDDLSVLLEDPSGHLWIGTGGFGKAGSGLNRFDPQTGQVTRFSSSLKVNSLSSDSISALALDPEGKLWVGTGGYGLTGLGLNHFDPQTGHATRYMNQPENSLSLSSNDISSLFLDPTGVLWISTWGGGLERMDTLNPGVFIHSRHDAFNPQSLSSDILWSIAQDQTGIFWIGTVNGGLNKLNPQLQRFRLYRNLPHDDSSIGFNAIGPIEEDPSGKIWVGTLGGGLDLFDPQTGSFQHYRVDLQEFASQQYNTYLDLLIDRQGDLWIATLYGIATFNPQTQAFTRYQNDTQNPVSLVNDNVAGLLEDPDGRLWVATLGGLDWYDREIGQFSHVSIPGSPAFVSLYLDSQGDLWAGTWGSGLFHLYLDTLDGDQVEYEHFVHDADEDTSLSDDSIWTIHEDRDGILWFGTQVGVNRYDPSTGSFSHLTVKEGLPDNTVLCMLADDQGYIWVSTNHGLSRLDPATNTMHNYYASDGLQSNEFVSNACNRTRSGDLYFGGVNGLTAFNPAEIVENALPPPVSLTMLRVFNDPYPADLTGKRTINLSYQQNFIAFEFVALDYHAPLKNQYAYRLEGFDKDWVQAGTRRYASYTNLEGGEYVFRVKAANNDGVWNENGVAISLHITPPWWQNGWFRGGMIVLILGLASAGVWGRLEVVRRQAHHLEAEVLERTNELRDSNLRLEQEIVLRKMAEAELASNAAAELQQSEARFQAMFDNAAIGMALFKLDRYPIAVNAALLKMTGGYSREEMLQMTGAELTHPADREVGLQEFQELIAGKRESFQVEKRYVRRDGRVFWVRLTTSAVRNAAGEVQYLVSMIEDIDVRKQVQIELQESEARFRGLFDHAEMGIVLTNIEKPVDLEDDANFYRLIHQQRCNPALQRMFGYTESELQEMDLTLLVHPEDRGMDKQYAKELYSGQRDDYRIEKRYVRKDGSVFLGRLSYSMVRDEHGSPRMAIGIVEDMDEERKAQEELRRSEARFRAMFDNTAVGIALMSLEKRAVQVNQAAQKIVGYDEDELLQVNPTDLALEEFRYIDQDQFARLVAGKIDQYQVEKRYRRKNGELFWGRVNYSSVKDAKGKPLYLIGLIEDIDDEKRAKEKLAEQEAEHRHMLEKRVAERTLELRQTNERLQQEILQRQKAEEALAVKAADEAVIAERTRLARELHDAVTQTLFSASLIAEVLPELWSTDVAEAENSTEELRQLTRGALAEMRTLLLELRPAVLTQSRFEDLLRQLCEALIGRARLPIQLLIEGKRQLPPDVQVALYRIAQESLNNIVKYARPDTVWVELRMSERGVLMTVRDNGIGFDPAMVKPTSLGQRIMRERAENIDAELTITSQPGQGTEVTVFWQDPGQDAA